MLVYQVVVESEDVLALVVVDHVEVLQRGDNVLFLDGGRFAQFVDGDLRLRRRRRRRAVVGVDARLRVQQNLERCLKFYIFIPTTALYGGIQKRGSNLGSP